jgi:hypothetical protein
MDNKTLKQIMQECISHSLKTEGKVGQSTLDTIIARMPVEDWERLPGNNTIKRRLFRGYDENERRLNDGLNGWKWKATKILMYYYIDCKYCKKCNKKLPFKGFHLHHIDPTKDYFTFDISNFQCVHKGCHIHSEDAIHSDVDWEEALSFNNFEQESNNMNTGIKKEKGMKEATDFLFAVRTFSHLDHVKADAAASVMNLTEQAISGIVGTLSYIGVLASVSEIIRFNSQFKHLGSLTDDQIKNLYRVWKTDAARPVEGLDLALQFVHNEVRCFDRPRHPAIISLLQSYGFDMASLAAGRKPFVEKRKKGHEGKLKLVDQIEKLQKLANESVNPNLASMSIDNLKKMMKPLGTKPKCVKASPPQISVPLNSDEEDEAIAKQVAEQRKTRIRERADAILKKELGLV